MPLGTGKQERRSSSENAGEGVRLTPFVCQHPATGFGGDGTRARDDVWLEHLGVMACRETD